MEEEDFSNSALKAIYDAVKSGNVMILEFILV